MALNSKQSFRPKNFTLQAKLSTKKKRPAETDESIRMGL